MYFNRFDSYFYSRPISYRSYNPKITRKDILPFIDPETDQVLDFFKRNNIQVTDLGGLARGIRFGDLEVGKRTFNHNNGSYYANNEYYIHQWKPTNDLTKEHPVGSHTVTKSFPELLGRLERVLGDQKKTYK